MRLYLKTSFQPQCRIILSSHLAGIVHTVPNYFLLLLHSSTALSATNRNKICWKAKYRKANENVGTTGREVPRPRVIHMGRTSLVPREEPSQYALFAWLTRHDLINSLGARDDERPNVIFGGLVMLHVCTIAQGECAWLPAPASRRNRNQHIRIFKQTSRGHIVRRCRGGRE